jgi:protein-S-isoprenylcysteine O-methyltransferase Ste14
MYGKEKQSNKTRYIIFATHFIIIGFIWWLYFGDGIMAISELFNIDMERGNNVRLIILYSFAIVYFIRVCFTLFVFLKRSIDLKEMAAIIFGIAFYQIGFAITGTTRDIPIDLFDLIPIVLFILGSYLNTISEFQRKMFKEKEDNKGKLYTEGLFKYAQHINYFGDFVWILGFALMTRNIWALIMPLFCFLGFLFINIPMLDKYLEEKYQNEFIAWQQKTKKFIPFIY